MIPAKGQPQGPDQLRRDIYRWRHLIENTFAKLKEFRAVATRYDKTDGSFRATTNLAAAQMNVNRPLHSPSHRASSR